LSTLTKICVVLVFVLSLIACAVFFQKVATDANWKEYGIRQRRRANLNETEVQHQMLAQGHWRRLYESERDKVINLDQNNRNILDTKNNEIRRLAALNGELQGNIKELTAQLENLQKTLQVQIDHAKDLSAKLDKQRSEKIATENKLRDLQDQLKENLTQIESLVKAGKVYDEKIAELEKQNENLAKALQKATDELQRRGPATVTAGGTTASEPAPVPTDKIEGSVIAVRDQLASLNVGSKDKVKKDMVFIIYRGAEFVGHLRVADVGTNNCAGVVYETVRDVRVGDKATTKLD